MDDRRLIAGVSPNIEGHAHRLVTRDQALKLAEEDIRNLGISTREAKLYLAMVDIGVGAPVARIADKAGMKPNNAAIPLKALVDRGLIFVTQERGTTFYRISDSRAALELLVVKKERDAVNARTSFQRFTAFLPKMISPRSPPPFKSYSGPEGLRMASMDFLNTATPVYSRFSVPRIIRWILSGDSEALSAVQPYRVRHDEQSPDAAPARFFSPDELRENFREFLDVSIEGLNAFVDPVLAGMLGEGARLEEHAVQLRLEAETRLLADYPQFAHSLILTARKP